MIQIDEINCTGCGACYNVCPKRCIQMKRDNFGFLTPKININDCINCGLCDKTCPEIDNDQLQNCLESYVFVTNNEDNLMNSSSGGAFTEIARIFCKNNYSLYGATIINGYVQHIRITDINDLYKVKKSKYSQSNIYNIYKQIKEDLNNQRKVVFVGTPCQVAGIKKYIGKHDELLLIDLFCTGVCSPFLLKNHISYLENKKFKKVTNYDMRYKNYKNNKMDIMNVHIKYNDNEVENNENDLNLFIKCFRHHVAFRESCYRCKYANKKRIGDISLGDYWDKFSEDCEFKGVSAILINNNKIDIKEDLINKGRLKKVEYSKIILQQPALNKPVVKPKFPNNYSLDSESAMINFAKKYGRPGLKIRILMRISQMLPNNFASILKKLYYTRG